LPSAIVDLTELTRKLATRDSSRTEATVQSQLHVLLLTAPLQLEEGHLHDIVLEQPAGQRRRIDVEAGHCVFEVKRDLRKGKVREDAEVQLAGYVAQRREQTGQRYVGVLMDGCEWHVYRLREAALVHVSSLTVSADQPDVESLCVWLEAVLATSELLIPRPREIERQLGAKSPGHLLDITELADLYQANRDRPDVVLKRQLWARLLTTALGTAFHDDDRLFVQHTLLVVTAEVIAHAVLDINPRQIAPRALVSGQYFRDAKVLGVVEADFFDWVAEVPGGDEFVRGLARRLCRFAWANVEHDVLKVLYESVIPAQQRKQLGEYYTPDWLAQHIVDEAVTDPLSKRVLDPSCGSGTFVFHAARRYLNAADNAGVPNKEALAGVCAHVMGMDLHPVAVTLARVTYLLAIGPERLKDRGPIAIPVFLGDSLQWAQQEETLQTHGALVVSANDGLELLPAELRFPDTLVANVGQFDALVAELAERATSRTPGSAPPPLTQVHGRYEVVPDDQPIIDKTFRQMCSLHDQGRDHIWGYYVRNLVRPRWLAREANHVDVLVGNPPWLAYRFMTPPMQRTFQQLLKERNLWPGAKTVTHVDLSALFVVRCVERYLKKAGQFAFVMPWAVLSRQHFAGFRAGAWPRPQGFPVGAAFDQPWDLHAVRPTFFEVPCSVVRGVRTEERDARPIPEVAEAWEGALPEKNVAWAVAEQHLTRSAGLVKAAPTIAPASPYAPRFAQGATLVPRMLSFVEELPAGPLGHAAGEVKVRSRRTAFEKPPWKTLPPLEATVEQRFVFPVYTGDTVVPFRPLASLRGVIPWDGTRLLDGSDEVLAQYPGFGDWWTKADAIWQKHRSSERLTLIERFDYVHGLTNQFADAGDSPPIRVVYSASGMYVAAAVIADPKAVIEHALYWGACTGLDEAHYLCAVLNSDRLTLAVRAYQARGEHNPRHFDKYIWQLPIPAFDPTNALHANLAALGAKAGAIAAALTLPKTRFEKQRRFVREQLATSDVGKAIEAAVAELLGSECGGAVNPAPEHPPGRERPSRKRRG
jgi:N-6 DNA methylase